MKQLKGFIHRHRAADLLHALGAAGFELASEQREGDTVTMTLTVKDRL